jgi:cytochrome P450
MHNIFDMMGVPAEHRGKLAHMSQFAGGWNDPELLAGRQPLEAMFESMVYQRELSAELIAERRAHPTADLMSALVQAEVDGEKLTDDDLMSFFALLNVAGNDTTRQSASHTMLALSAHPEQKRYLLEDLDGRLPVAVEEMVRWATPIMTFRRTAARDTELDGVRITAGDKIILFYASANWDTEVFDHPERLDLARHPNPHISFGGGGIHHCLGNQLARQQLKALWREVLTRLPDIEVCGDPVFTRGNFFHGMSHLPVRFTPAG